MTVDAGRLHAHFTAPSDDTPASRDGERRDVTGETSAPAIARHECEPGDPIVMALRRRLRELDTQLLEERAKADRAVKAAGVQAERFRAWLVVVLLKCRGSAPGIASQALYSTEWPLGVRLPSEKTITRPEDESEGHDD